MVYSHPTKIIMPIVKEKDWQKTKPTIRERTNFTLNKDLLSDVNSVECTSDDESESKQVIPAHRFVLSIGSPVFETMFKRFASGEKWLH